MVPLLFCLDTFAQNPTRKVLYALETNEVMEECRLDGHRFALLVRDTLTGGGALVFNGKRVGSFDSFFDCDLGDIDVNDPDGYGFIYADDKGYYVNKGGNREGPYEYVAWTGGNDYRYVLAGRVYDNVNGRACTSQGVFDLGYFAGSSHIAKNGKSVESDGRVWTSGKNYAYTSRSKDCISLWINGQCVDTRSSIEGVRINARGDYAYCYYDDDAGMWHVVKNGVRIDREGYRTSARALHLTEDGEVAYMADNKLHLPEMEEEAEFDDMKDFTYFDSGRYAFVYYAAGVGEYYVRIKNQEDRGPYKYVGFLKTDPNGSFMYSYADDKSHNYYVRTDKSEYGPFDNVFSGYIRNGDYGFDCSKDGEAYNCLNGTMSETNAFNMETERHTFHAHRECDYVVIDGQRMGNSAAFKCHYDKDKNAFVWYGIEGRELAVYEYALD